MEQQEGPGGPDTTSAECELLRETYARQLADELANPHPKRFVNKRTNRNLLATVNDAQWYGVRTLDEEPGARTWIWSDLHVGHDNVIRYCKRPFESGGEMDDALLGAWEKCVAAGDTIICVGDVQVSWATRGSERIAGAPGKKILIAGNHDFTKKGGVIIPNGHPVVCGAAVMPGNPVLWLTHMPLYAVLPPGRPRMNVHGHVHNNEPLKYHRINVSVEYTGYRPLLLTDVRRLGRALLRGVEPKGATTAARCAEVREQEARDESGEAK